MAVEEVDGMDVEAVNGVDVVVLCDVCPVRDVTACWCPVGPHVSAR